VLTNVLNTLGEKTPLGQAFKDRAVDVSMLKVLGDPVDQAEALVAYRYLLERADGSSRFARSSPESQSPSVVLGSSAQSRGRHCLARRLATTL
jgi:hypothetical protein